MEMFAKYHEKFLGNIMEYHGISWLVGGLEHFLFFHILGIIIPTDQYFSEGLKPPTRWYITKCNGLSWSIIEYTGM